MDYGMPHADIMPIELREALQPVPAKTNPLGVKGTGEAGTTASTSESGRQPYCSDGRRDINRYNTYEGDIFDFFRIDLPCQEGDDDCWKKSESSVLFEPEQLPVPERGFD